MTVPAFAEPVEGQVILPGIGPEPEPEVVTVQCDECGEPFIGPAGGRGSAPMLLGRHRWSVHRIKGDGTRAPAKAKATGRTAAADAAYVEARPVAGTIAAVGAVVKGSGPPRAEQLAAAFGIGLAELTKGAAKIALRADPIQQQAQADNPAAAATREEHLTAALSLTRETAAKVMAPAARIFAGTELNKRIGRHLVENTDLAPAVTELAEFGHAWLTYVGTMRAVRRELAALRAQQQAEAGFIAPAPVPQAPPVLPDMAPAAAAGGLDPTLGAGRIATAAHVPVQS